MAIAAGSLCVFMPLRYAASILAMLQLIFSTVLCIALWTEVSKWSACRIIAQLYFLGLTIRDRCRRGYTNHWHFGGGGYVLYHPRLLRIDWVRLNVGGPYTVLTSW